MKKIIALLLVLVMSLALFSGCEEPEYVSHRRPQKEKVTEPISMEELIPPLEEDAEVLTFRYEEKHADAYYQKLEEYKQAAMDNDREKIDSLDLELNELDLFILDQATIAEVLHYCNTKDEDASQLYLDMTDVVADITDANLETMREIYNSDCELKDYIFEGWTQEDIDYMLAYTEEVKEVQKREAELLVEYREFSEKEKEKETGKIYAEIASNSNRVAENYGYDNYYEYAYEVIRARDYSMQEIKQLRTYAKDYLLDIYDRVIRSFAERRQNLTQEQMAELQSFLYDDYDENAYLDDYLDALPLEMSSDMRTMFDGNVIFPKSSKAREGAFTTLISNKPFCYFSKDYRNSSTLVHEMGHYYGGIHGDLMNMPLDLAEVQSQGNEWLMIVYTAQEMDDDVFKCYLDYRFLNDLSVILISVIIDEFEERVYTSEDLENFDTEDFEQIMEEVCEEYGGIELFTDYLNIDIQSYWREVVLESQVYYISYAVSMVPSLDIYFCASEDWEKALEIYQTVTMDITGDDTFLGILEEAGLASPFEIDLYAKLMEHYDMQIPDYDRGKAA